MLDKTKCFDNCSALFQGLSKENHDRIYLNKKQAVWLVFIEFYLQFILIDQDKNSGQTLNYDYTSKFCFSVG